jgi:hypothetical protein
MWESHWQHDRVPATRLRGMRCLPNQRCIESECHRTDDQANDHPRPHVIVQLRRFDLARSRFRFHAEPTHFLRNSSAINQCAAAQFRRTFHELTEGQPCVLRLRSRAPRSLATVTPSSRLGSVALQRIGFVFIQGADLLTIVGLLFDFEPRTGEEIGRKFSTA